MKLDKKNIVIDSDLRTSFYYSVVQNKNDIKIYRNYFNLHRGRTLQTYYYESVDGIDFVRGDTIFKDNCLSHNFYVFFHEDKYYGIGGMDSWKNNIDWHNINTFDEFKIKFKYKYGHEYTRDEARYEKAIKRLKTEKWILDYSDGLYLFESKDGVDWTLKHDRPIITTKHKGFESALMWKATDFDGHISCVHDGKKFILYVRDNIKKGIRFIQFAVSEDLINWSKFKRINLKSFDEDIDNYYYASVFKVEKSFYGLFPYFNPDYACIRLVKSDDGVNWTIEKDLFASDPIRIEGKYKNPCHPVNGIVRMNGKYYIYIHNNYMGHDEEKLVFLRRYEIEF